MLFGVVVIGASFLLLSRISSLVTFYAAFVTMSLGFSFAAGVVSQTAVVNWFVRRRAIALGILVSAAAPAGLLPPVVRFLITEYGWRDTLVMIGIGAWLVCLPLAALVRHKPEKYGMRPDGDPVPEEATSSSQAGGDLAEEVEGIPWRQAVRTRSFWFLAMAGALSGAAISSTILLLVPYLESVGVPPQQAALGITILSSVSLAGRLGLGWLGDRMEKRYLLAVAFGLVSVGTFALAFVTSFWMVLPALLFLSPGYGGSVPLRPALLADYFGRRYFGAITGLMQTVMAGGAIAAPFVAALIFDRTGSYRMAWIIFSFVALIALVLILLTRPPKFGVGGVSDRKQASVAT